MVTKQDILERVNALKDKCNKGIIAANDDNDGIEVIKELEKESTL
jgi:hypothetical protein